MEVDFAAVEVFAAASPVCCVLVISLRVQFKFVDSGMLKPRSCTEVSAKLYILFNR